MSPWALAITALCAQLWYISQQITVRLWLFLIKKNYHKANRTDSKSRQHLNKQKAGGKDKEKKFSHNLCHKAGGVCVLHRLRAASACSKQQARRESVIWTTVQLCPFLENVKVSTTWTCWTATCWYEKQTCRCSDQWWGKQNIVHFVMKRFAH